MRGHRCGQRRSRRGGGRAQRSAPESSAEAARWAGREVRMQGTAVAKAPVKAEGWKHQQMPKVLISNPIVEVSPAGNCCKVQHRNCCQFL